MQRLPLALGLILFFTGVLVGGYAYTWLGPYQASIDTYVQGALVAGLAAIDAAVLAIVGSWLGSTRSAESAVRAAQVTAEATRDEGIASREEARKAGLRERRAELVAQIVTGSSHHGDEIAAQLARRIELAGTADDSTMPTVGSTADIAGAINRLYALGSQHLADLSTQLLRVLYSLDEFVYVAERDRFEGKIRGPSQEEIERQNVLQKMQTLIKTDLMVAGSAELGELDWQPEGTLHDDYLIEKETAAQELIARLAPKAKPGAIGLRTVIRQDPGTAR